MQRKALAIVLLCIVLSMFTLCQANAAETGIWLQATASGKQSWAYYPYSLQKGFVGGKWCPPFNGTSYFTVAPGTTILRKIIVHNHEPVNDSATLSVTGLPAGWNVTLKPKVLTKMISVKIAPKNADYSPRFTHESFATMLITVPKNAKPGRYTYTITAVSGLGARTTLRDTIVVGIK